MFLKIQKNSKKYLSITINKTKKGEVIFIIIPHFGKTTFWITNYRGTEVPEITFLFFKISVCLE